MDAVDYERLSVRAKNVLLATRGTAQSTDVDDLTQETVLRFLERGMSARLDPRKGSEFSLLCGVQDKIGMEFARTRRRFAAGDLDDDRQDDKAVDPFEEASRNELMQLLGRWFCGLTDQQQASLMRRYGALFGRWASGGMGPNDYLVVHRAIRRLRRSLRERRLMDQ